MRLTALGSCPRPQYWGDWRILWLRPYGKADEVSADPRRLPPSVPGFRSAAHRKHKPHQVRLTRQAMLGEHVLHMRADRALSAAHRYGDVAAMGRGESTIRSHVKHMFAKHGLSRQADLVRLVLAVGGAPESRH